MPTDSEGFICNNRPRPLGKYDGNCVLDSRVKEVGYSARKTGGKENDTVVRAARGGHLFSQPHDVVTPKKRASKTDARAVRHSNRNAAVKTPVRSNDAQKKLNQEKHDYLTSLETAECSGLNVPLTNTHDGPLVVARIPHLGKPGGMIRTGPIRVKTPHKNATRSTPKRVTRVGIDGTSRTPSKELLRSTASSRGHQIAHPREDHDAVVSGLDALSILDQSSEDLDNSFDSSLYELELETNGNARYGTQHPEVSRRDFLENPVALTLLNGGKENWQYLLEMDRAPAGQSPTRFSQESPVHKLMKVSSDLWEVKNKEDVSSIARPKASTASREISFEA